MAFLTVKAESVQTEAGSSYATTSGIYTTTLRACEITSTKNGATQANYFFKDAMSYGNNIIGVNGQPTFGYKIIEALAATLGEDSLSDPEATSVTFKKGAKELSCIPELNDVQVKAWIQIGYRMYKGEIREDVMVKRFYRATDGAAGSEALSGESIGERLAKDTEVASEIKYEDGTTPESVAAWKKSQQTGGGAAAPAAAASNPFPGKKASSGFPSAK